MAEWTGGPPETVDWTTHAQTMDEVRELRAERDENQGEIEGLKEALITCAGERDKALEQVETLRRALRPVAEMAARLKAKGHLDPEEGICGDPDLAFPVLDTPLSVTDLERILIAFGPAFRSEQDKGPRDG